MEPVYHRELNHHEHHNFSRLFRQRARILLAREKPERALQAAEEVMGCRWGKTWRQLWEYHGNIMDTHWETMEISWED